MSRSWTYKDGEWNLLCDVCSKKIKASEARHRWDGLIVCTEDYETRHAQDFVRVKPEKNTIPFSRPQQEDVFTDINWFDAYVEVGYIENADGYVFEVLI
jgi:hypothetical protein